MDARSFIEQAADHLSRFGWWVADNFLSPEMTDGLREDAIRRYHDGSFSKARIGSGDQKTLATSIRADETHWLTASNPHQQAFLLFIEELREGLNRQLFLGLQRQESHYALYKPGTYYRRHIDNFQGRSPRMLTFTCYLNPDWRSDQGGALRLYTRSPQDADVQPQETAPEAFIDIEPEMGRLVLFMSQVFPHEVLPTHRDRWSIAGWLRNDPADPLLANLDPHVD